MPGVCFKYSTVPPWLVTIILDLSFLKIYTYAVKKSILLSIFFSLNLHNFLLFFFKKCTSHSLKERNVNGMKAFWKIYMEKYLDKAQHFNWINSNDNFVRNENKIRRQSNLKYLNCFNYRFFFISTVQKSCLLMLYIFYISVN